MPNKDNMNAVEPSGEQLEHLRKTSKAAEIRRLLRMIPVEQMLDVDFENYLARDVDCLVASDISHSFTRPRQLRFRAPGATLGNSLYTFRIRTLKRSDLEAVTLGIDVEPQLRHPQGHPRSTSSLISLSLGYVPLEKGLSEILSCPVALQDFRYAGRYATAEELSLTLEPLHRSLKRLNITAFTVEANDPAAFYFSHCSRLEYLAIPDGLVLEYDVDLRNGHFVKQHFLQRVEGQALKGSYPREIDALLNLVDLKLTQLPKLQRVVNEHKRHGNGPTNSWILPPSVKQALDAAELLLFNDLQLSEEDPVKT